MIVFAFVITGCESFVLSPNLSTEPTPTPSPVAVDGTCPDMVNTVVREIYDAERSGAFKVVVTFDEAIESGCIEDPAKWVVEIRPSAGGEDLTTEDGDIEVYGVTVDGKKVTVLAQVVGGEVPDGRYTWTLKDCAVFDESGNFCCRYSDSVCYAEPVCEECVEECPLGGGICQ
ncbi:MAG: hypothetical protein HPY68_07170 [Candidatus Atribacteria bacterium]|nr:hypothetical protein [Candidatus Atribacteria bacterium]